MGIESASASELVITDSDLGAGYVTLAWPDLEGQSFTLQGNDGSGWAELYDGSNTASTLTGLSNGDYRFRVTSDSGATTEPVSLTVDHHSLARAFSFFGTGAIVLIILLAVLIRGPRDTDSTA